MIIAAGPVADDVICRFEPLAVSVEPAPIWIPDGLDVLIVRAPAMATSTLVSGPGTTAPGDNVPANI